MDVIERIKDLTLERGWSEYRLVKESGLSASTISNIFHRQTVPGIATLEAICAAYGITLSQFFGTTEQISLNEEQRELLRLWSHLNNEQKKHLVNLLKSI